MPRFQRLWPLGLPVSGPSERAVLPVLNVFSMALSFSIRIQLPEQCPSRSGSGRGERTLGGVVLPRPQAASSPVSSLLPHPHSGPCAAAWEEVLQEPCSVFSVLRLVVVVGWRRVGVQGRLMTWHPFMRISLHLFKVDLEERPGAPWGWEEKNCWDHPWPLLPSQLVCAPHSAKQKFCCFAHPTLLLLEPS